jgi:hypothetical protein
LRIRKTHHGYHIEQTKNYYFHIFLPNLGRKKPRRMNGVNFLMMVLKVIKD